jgi:DNA (cytosine-5)-methyltransferase 1
MASKAKEAAQPELFGEEEKAPSPVESYWIDTPAGEIVRSISLRTGGTSFSRVPAPRTPGQDLRSAYDSAWLRSKLWPDVEETGPHPVRVADIFSGCGLMTLGVAEAARAVGRRCAPVVSVDFNDSASSVYLDNFPMAEVLPIEIEAYIDREPGEGASAAEQEFVNEIGSIDFLVGGPPCQGNSDLNNHTRRKDERNALFIKVARFAELVRPTHIVVENVRGIVHDTQRVYQRTSELLKKLGYSVDGRLVHADRFGVAQRRQRFLLVASLERSVSIETMMRAYETPKRDLSWACRDLLGKKSTGVLDSAPIPTETNAKRISYLFKHQLFDLPDSQRPDCHKNKEHSYRSVYGRLAWDQPAQTITTGFGSMGQGRYVHPEEPRTITPHEAARLQFIPDFFEFRETRRTALAELIGNGVPPKLTYILALELLR